VSELGMGAGNGRRRALAAISGEVVRPVPVALFTWGFDYYWKAAGIEPWRLALGSAQTWHTAHTALYERHKPDVVFYTGSGPDIEPEIAGETSTSWRIRQGDGPVMELIKRSLTLHEPESGTTECSPIGKMESSRDVDAAISEFGGWGEQYLSGLTRLIGDLGERALVLPHHSPGYVCACYAFGFERSMELVLTEPELFHYACGRYASGDALRMRELADAGADAVFVADGWASMDVISPPMFDEFALPYQRSIIEAGHNAGLKVVLWNEGDILPILDREAALDMDAFAFEQPRKGAQTTVEAVRRAFGPERCLFGNVDSEELFVRGNPDEIRRAVATQMSMNGDGPFVLSTGAPIPSDVEMETVDVFIHALD
jgi:hypothetical protein